MKMKNYSKALRYGATALSTFLIIGCTTGYKGLTNNVSEVPSKKYNKLEIDAISGASIPNYKGLLKVKINGKEVEVDAISGASTPNH